jgi:hypothetical protein
VNIISQLCRHVSDDWYDQFTDHKPEAIYPLIIRKAPSRWNIFFFEKGSRDPLAFAKMTTDPGQFDTYRNEYEMLKALSQRCAPGLEQTFPVSVYQIERDHLMVNLEKALVGMPLMPPRMLRFPVLYLGEMRSRIGRVLGWWKAFVGGSRCSELSPGSYLLGELDGIQDRYASTFPREENGLGEIERLRKRIGALSIDSMTLSPVHGDFWSGNLNISDNGGVQVFDWERCQKRGIPLYDIFSFCTTLVPRSLFNLDGFSSTFIKGNRLTGCLVDMMKSASGYMGIDDDLRILLFEMFLYEMATTGMKHFGRKISHDDAWNGRLRLFQEHGEIF